MAGGQARDDSYWAPTWHPAPGSCSPRVRTTAEARPTFPLWGRSWDTGLAIRPWKGSDWPWSRSSGGASWRKRLWVTFEESLEGHGEGAGVEGQGTVSTPWLVGSCRRATSGRGEATRLSRPFTSWPVRLSSCSRTCHGSPGPHGKEVYFKALHSGSPSPWGSATPDCPPGPPPTAGRWKQVLESRRT